MTKEQMEMLSVKSTIERVVQGYIITYSYMDISPATVNQFFDAVEKLIAAMFVSGQINNNYLVRADNVGNLHIAITVGQHNTQLTFLLPNSLRWTVEKMIPKVETNKMLPDVGTKFGRAIGTEDSQYFEDEAILLSFARGIKGDDTKQFITWKDRRTITESCNAENAYHDATLAYNNAMKVVER